MTLSLKKYEMDDANYRILVGGDGMELDWATLGALYSRSTSSAEEALDKTTKSRDRVIEQYYIGYGHESIGDMVDIKMFIENIPMWIVFILESHSLFRGQESSTRYIDFSKQPEPNSKFYDVKAYRDNMRTYTRSLGEVTKELEERVSTYGVGQQQYRRAVNARAFDICRGLLPVVASTNFAWFGNLNSIRNHLVEVMVAVDLSKDEVPDMNWKTGYIEELKLVVEFIWHTLNEHYPQAQTSLFDQMEKRTNRILRTPNADLRYRGSAQIGHYVPSPGSWVASRSNTNDIMRPDAHIQRQMFILEGNLDFGSLRDLNRHRRNYQEVGFILDGHRTRRLHFNNWYTQKLAGLIRMTPDLQRKIDQTKCGDLDSMLMGHELPFYVECDMAQAEYLFRLRCNENSHPSLVNVVANNWRKAGWPFGKKDNVENGLPPSYDAEYVVDLLTRINNKNWVSLPRGNHTIEKKSG